METMNNISSSSKLRFTVDKKKLNLGDKERVVIGNRNHTYLHKLHTHVVNFKIL